MRQFVVTVVALLAIADPARAVDPLGCDLERNLGAIREPTGNGTPLGEKLAVVVLDSLATAEVNLTTVCVAWTDVYPSGGRYSKRVSYNRQTRTLILLYPDTKVTEEYSPVSGAALAALARREYPAFGRLTELGATQTSGHARQSLEETQADFRRYHLEHTAVLEMRFESAWQVWVRLTPEKYTTKANVEAIARQIAKSWSLRSGQKRVSCTVWALDGSGVYAEGRCSSP